MALRFVLALVFACSFACARNLDPKAPSLSLAGTDGQAHAIASGRATAIVFFSEHCPCVRAHDARVIALAREFEPRGIAFYAVDSEVGGTVDVDRERAKDHGYPFPILVDENARLARALGAEYATYAVVVDASGNVLYRGGIDSDHTHLSNGATPYLREALEDLAAGRAQRRTHTEALGCALRTW